MKDEEQEETALTVQYYKADTFDFVRVRWQTGEVQDFYLTQLHELAFEAYKRGWEKGLKTGKVLGRECSPTVTYRHIGNQEG